MTTFSYDGAVIQYDTITVAGVYDIVVSGGQSGSNTETANAGGLAASSGGDIFLQAGAVLEIVVGGTGNNSAPDGAGGGGGSFVIEINNGFGTVDINEVIAGGGGGAGLIGAGAGGSGRTAPTGGNGGGFSAGAGGVNGAAGAGAGGAFGGGGGGFEGGHGGFISAGSGGIAGGNDFAGGGGGEDGGANGGFGGGGGGGGGSYVNPGATDVTQSAAAHSGNGAASITLAPITKEFNFDGAVIQYDTITATGTYDIFAAGGEGGSNTETANAGGLAASSGGDIFLQAGAVLEIVVGGTGNNSAPDGGGGGGGSFVIEINNGSSAVDINEVIAGGGGGAGLIGAGAGGSGLAAPTGGNGGGFSAGAGGVNGAAGAGAGGAFGGGGGGFEGGHGGFISAGGGGIAGGNDFAGGGGGEDGGANGGFGGGGGGGGGGGYGGGGGGSYVISGATEVTQSTGVYSGNGVVTITPVCYCLGTRIRTARGEIAVEDLAIGDLAVTATGRTRPVVWIGRRRIDLTRHADPPRARPIRIVAGAFPGGVPHRDLLVSPAHAVVFDGMLFPAKLLANGASIAADTACREVTYFHIELASHDVLMAEGLAAESYLDTGNRDMFEDAGPSLVLHPDFSTGQQARASWSCLPFVDRPDQVEPVWRALADRAEALGWAVPRPVLTDDPDLHVRVGTRRINPVAVRKGRYTFVLPHGGAQVTLASRAARPSEARPWMADDRLLGAKVRRMVHRSGDDGRDVAMDDPALEQGWWAVEMEGSWPGRWTSGDALLPCLGAGVLEVELSGAMRYPAAHAAPAEGIRPERLAA